MFRQLAAAAALAFAIPATAAVTVSVDAQAMPWAWEAGGLNDAYQFGAQDGIAPVVVSFASAGITMGGTWAIVATGGLTSAFGGVPTADHNGYVASPFKDDDPGSSGNYFPSHYTPGLWNSDPGAGVFLNALVWAFTDDNGQIVSTPDAMNVILFDDGTYGFVFGKSSSVPAGATQIQFGLNDDIFADNTGALQVCVGSNFAACLGGPVPEPHNWTLMIAGFALTGLAVRRRRHGFATA
jgi:hypothetical protein